MGKGYRGVVREETICGRPCALCLPERISGELPLILCHAGAEIAGQLPEVLAALPGETRPFALVSVLDVSWDADYTPWASDCLPGRALSGGADRYLDDAENRLLTALEEELPLSGEVYALGYSLGGLCALYSLARRPLYAGGASVSGALWYPGFEAWFQAGRPDVPVYCSLGRAESRTRHPLMGLSAQCAQKIACRPDDFFEWNNGNHFFEVPQRLAKAIGFLLGGAR